MERCSGGCIITVENLRHEIRDRDQDLEKAGLFGKQLLEEKYMLNEKIDQLMSENEAFKQEKYSLIIDLETSHQTINSQAAELELQRQQFDSMVEKYNTLQKDSNFQKQQIITLISEKHDLKRSQEESVGENRTLQSKITQLEQQMKTLECKLDVANMSLNDTVYEAEDAKSYELKNKQLEMTLSEVQHELESSKLEETRLKTFILELEEDIRERDKDLKIYYAEIQKFKDINSELQCELDTFKLEQVDVNRRGNSMFGELDDRRRYVEKEYKLLANKHTTLLDNYEGNREELARCKVQMATLLSMSSRRYQEAYIKKLEDSLEDAKREVREVTVKLDRILKVQKQASTNISSTGGDQYDYLRVLHAQAERKIKTLESEMMSLRVKNLADNDKLVESQRLVYCLQEEIDALKMTNLKLTNEIKDLTTVPDAAAPPTPEPNVEILPNYKPEDPDATKENNESGNTDVLNDSDIVPGQILLDDDGYREIRPPRLSSGVVLREMNAALSRGEPEHFNKRLSFLKSKLSKAGVEKQRSLRDYGAKSESFVTNERKEGNCAQQ